MKANCECNFDEDWCNYDGKLVIVERTVERPATPLDQQFEGCGDFVEEIVYDMYVRPEDEITYLPDAFISIERRDMPQYFRDAVKRYIEEGL